MILKVLILDLEEDSVHLLPAISLAIERWLQNAQ